MTIASIVGRLLTGAWLGHRMRLVIVCSLGASALIGGFPGAAMATSAVRCAASSTYGSTCIKVFGTDLTITDVQGWMTEPSIGYLKGLNWRIDLEKYKCDPIGVPKSTCPVTDTWKGNVFKGDPPTQGTSCISWSFDNTLTTQQCENIGGRQVDRVNGYWPTFYKLPWTSGSHLWLCTEVAIESTSGVWHYNGAGNPNGVRGCTEVVVT